MGKREDDLAAELAAKVEAGEDPFGDHDDVIVPDDDEPEFIETAEVEEEEPAVEPTEPTAEELAEQEGETTEAAADEPVAEVVPEVAPEPEAEPSLPTYRTSDPSDLKAQRKALRQQEIEVEAKWAAGELDDSARAEKLSELRDQADELLVQITTTATLQAANEQQTKRQQEAVITGIKTQGKAQGLDYDDPKVAKQFDIAIQVLAVDPDNAGKTFAQLASAAHSTVLALRGISKAQGTPAKPAEARTAPKPPATLRNMPAAATQNVGSTLASTMARLKGPEYQAAYVKLTPKQRAELTDD